MKIALVSDAVFPFNKGGKETRIYYLTKYLAAHDHDVHVYTMRWWSQSSTYHADGVTYHAICPRLNLYKGNRRSILQGIVFGLSCLKLIRESFDVLEVDHMPFFPLYFSRVVCWLKRRPMYATWHEVWGLAYWRTYLGSIMGTIAYVIERGSVLLPNRIIAVSEMTEHQLRTKLSYKGPVDVVRNGVDVTEIAQIPAAARKADILFAGRLLPHKQVDLLIDAVGQLAVKYPELTVDIIGDGPEYDRLTAQIKRQSLTRIVTMRGFLEQYSDVLAAMKSSTVFVLPSTREGFGISALEAMAAGCRVVTVDSPDNATQYLVDDTNGAVCKLDATAMAAAIENQLSIKSSNVVSDRYDWAASGEALAKVYAA